MNLLHMKYAVEIAKTNSINKAAEKLYVGQPTLSRAIKELEASLGVAIFDRSAKGMFLTPDGEIFVRYAKNVLKQVDVIEEMFSKGTVCKKRFSISVPRASYVARAFSRFTMMIDKSTEVEMFYKETNSMRAIKNILQEDYKLGIIRYAENYDKYYKSMMEEKGLDYEMIAEFKYILLMNAESPLACKEKICFDDLKDYMEIAHDDAYVPSLPFSQVKKEELPDNAPRRIYVFERGSQFELLSHNPETFMWVSPVPDSQLKRYGLVQRHVDENKRIYKDVLIHRKDYVLSDLDKMFIDQLVRAKREII
ncbi:MAG: LysR family transcriptional regulator [Oscillospiraceae bacterium]|nr:LysR family transcriptional regulator [Oscillospiraceae bacterium]